MDFLAQLNYLLLRLEILKPRNYNVFVNVNRDNNGIRIVQNVQVSLQSSFDGFEYFSPVLFDDNRLTITESITSVILDNSDQLKNIFATTDREEITLYFTFKQDFEKSYKNLEIIHGISTEEFLNKIVSILEFRDIDKKTGLSIETFPRQIVKSTIFNINGRCFDRYIQNILANNSFLNSVKKIPEIIEFKNQQIEVQKELICQVLSLLVEVDLANQIVIGQNKVLSKNIFGNDYRGLDTFYQKILKVIRFIYDNNYQLFERLGIFKNIFDKSLSVEQISDVYGMNWDALLEETKFQYTLLLENTIKKFISDKKDILKDQFNLSNQITTQISDVKKAIMTDFITVSGIYLSKFVLQLIENDNYNSHFRVVGMVLFLYVLFLLVLIFVSGEFKLHRNFHDRLKVLNDYYPQVYLLEDNIVDNLTDRLSNPELKRLRNIICLKISIYLLVLIIIALETKAVCNILEILISTFESVMSFY